MAKEIKAEFELAVAKARTAVATAQNERISKLIAFADVEVRAAQVKQHELQNMIAMAANPAACPYPIALVHARIKELANLG